MAEIIAQRVDYFQKSGEAEIEGDASGVLRVRVSTEAPADDNGSLTTIEFTPDGEFAFGNAYPSGEPDSGFDAGLAGVTLELRGDWEAAMFIPALRAAADLLERIMARNRATANARKPRTAPAMLRRP